MNIEIFKGIIDEEDNKIIVNSLKDLDRLIKSEIDGNDIIVETEDEYDGETTAIRIRNANLKQFILMAQYKRIVLNPEKKLIKTQEDYEEDKQDG